MAARKHTTVEPQLAFVFPSPLRATQEHWRPVIGYEGLYEVSSWGRVRTIAHEEAYVHARTGDRIHRTVSPRLLKATRGRDKMRYLLVALYKQRKRKTWRIHILVMLAFVGPRPAGMHIHHIDANPFNNRLRNLAYVTPRENLLAQARHQPRKTLKQPIRPYGRA